MLSLLVLLSLCKNFPRAPVDGQPIWHPILTLQPLQGLQHGSNTSKYHTVYYYRVSSPGVGLVLLLILQALGGTRCRVCVHACAMPPREYSCTVSTLSIPILVYVVTYALASVSPGPSERLIYFLVNGVTYLLVWN